MARGKTGWPELHTAPREAFTTSSAGWASRSAPSTDRKTKARERDLTRDPKVKERPSQGLGLRTGFQESMPLLTELRCLPQTSRNFYLTRNAKNCTKYY